MEGPLYWEADSPAPSRTNSLKVIGIRELGPLQGLSKRREATRKASKNLGKKHHAAERQEVWTGVEEEERTMEGGSSYYGKRRRLEGLKIKVKKRVGKKRAPKLYRGGSGSY